MCDFVFSTNLDSFGGSCDDSIYVVVRVFSLLKATHLKSEISRLFVVGGNRLLRMFMAESLG